MSTLSERIAQAMRMKGLNQEKFAAAIGVTQAAVSDYVKGKKAPTSDRVPTLAAALDVDPEWLLFGRGRGPKPDLEAARTEYLERAHWAFRSAPEDRGRDFGNANLFSFRPSMRTVVMETLQNPKDQGLEGETPHVVYRLTTVKGEDLTRFLTALRWEDELQPRYEWIAEELQQQKIGRRISAALRNFQGASELQLLSIADYRTTGLTGEESDRGHFTALCRNNLDSVKEARAGRGGTYGLGKAAYWIASGPSLVLFNSDLSVPDSQGRTARRIFGRCELTWHELQGDSFAGPGWFGWSEGGSPAKSYWGNEALEDDLFLTRDRSLGTTGTTILVVGFRDPSEDVPEDDPRKVAQRIEAEVARCFWPALTDEKLQVRVEVADGKRVVWESNVEPERFVPRYVPVFKKYRHGETKAELQEPGDVVVKRVRLDVPAKRENRGSGHAHQAVVLISLADDVSDANRIAYFRGSQMVVKEELRPAGAGARPYSAVVICGVAAGSSEADAAAEMFLQTSEPPSHDDWTLTQDAKDLYERGAGAKIARFFDDVREEIYKLVRPNFEKLERGPRYLMELIRLNVSEPPPPGKPRLVVRKGVLNDEGRWEIEAEIRLLPQAPWRIVPAVVFAGETGSGQYIKTHLLEALDDGCRVEGDALVLDNGRSRTRFRIVTDADAHPIDSADAAADLVIKHSQTLSRSGE